MTKFIAIEINADGDSCENCEKLKSGYLGSWCHQFSVGIENFERLPACVAAEIPVQCSTCQYIGVGEMCTRVDDFKKAWEECCDDNYKNWQPQTRVINHD